jgi:hypothetical protein
MTTTFAYIINAALGIGLLGLLAIVMTTMARVATAGDRTATPHSRAQVGAERARPRREHAVRRTTRPTLDSL